MKSMVHKYGGEEDQRGKMKKPAFCQQAQMRRDIIYVFDLQTVCKRTASDAKPPGLAVKAKGAAHGEGKIGEFGECGGNESNVGVRHSWFIKVKHFCKHWLYSPKTHRSSFLLRDLILEVGRLQV